MCTGKGNNRPGGISNEEDVPATCSTGSRRLAAIRYLALALPSIGAIKASRAISQFADRIASGSRIDGQD